MDYGVKTVAFDLGGVLAYQDVSSLTEEELFLLQTYLNRKKVENPKLIEYAKSKITWIYLKIHRLNSEAIRTLEMLQQEKIRPAIWTNNIQEIEAWFEEVGLYNYIRKDDIINSIYLGFNKPSINFYRMALSILSEEPKHVLFLDDKPKNILVARNCGIIGEVYDMSESLEKKVQSEIIRRRIK